MDERQLRLDGNAAAGHLQELFARELTTARGKCSSCGAVGEMGVQHLYMYPLAPGGVLRCHKCESVLMVMVHAEGHVRLGAPGLAWMEMQEEAAT